MLIRDIANRLQGIIFELATEQGWKLIALEVMPDPVHLFINAPTTESPSQIAKWIKGRASHFLRKEFPDLKKLPSLWSPSYFVATTGKVSTEVVKRYIESQRSQ